jgi:hypothetical protein
MLLHRVEVTHKQRFTYHEVPEGDALVRSAAHEALPVRPDAQRPHRCARGGLGDPGSRVCGQRVEDTLSRGRIIYLRS